jgi:eukaryotic-like serine/threonine-protein kinase
MFQHPDARSSFSRTPEMGFRCVKYLSPPSDAAMAQVPLPFRGYDRETPVSNQVFEIYRSLYSYDKIPLDARVESVADSEEGWRQEKVSFAAAYGNERVAAYLFLPKKLQPPYQTVVVFPGAGVIASSSSKILSADLVRINFIVRSGRAVMYPIYKGTYERSDDLKVGFPNTTSSYRDHLICWSKNLGRSIDYLETRPEIDRGKIAYYGLSWGGCARRYSSRHGEPLQGFCSPGKRILPAEGLAGS